MLFRTRVANGRPAHPALLKRAIKGWRQEVRGYQSREIPNIYQDSDARKFLRMRGAAGCCLAKDLILCGREPSKSTICEELLHAMQFYIGLYDEVVEESGNVFAILVMEYIAAKILVNNEAKWRIPAIERKENRMRLRRFSCTHQKRIWRPAMAYTFEITRISKLAKAHVGVLDGKLLEGSVTTGSTAKLVHGGQYLPVIVKGVVLDSAKPKSGVLSLTVDLRQKAMKFASVGDRLVCA